MAAKNSLNAIIDILKPWNSDKPAREESVEQKKERRFLVTMHIAALSAIVFSWLFMKSYPYDLWLIAIALYVILAELLRGEKKIAIFCAQLVAAYGILYLLFGLFGSFWYNFSPDTLVPMIPFLFLFLLGIRTVKFVKKQDTSPIN